MDELLNEKEAAKLLGVSSGTLRNWRFNKNVPVPYRKIGKTIRYSRDDLQLFLDKCAIQPEGR